MFRYGQMQEWPSWAAYMVYINHLFLVINSSSNIIIYVAKDFKFRAALWQSLTCQSHARHHDTLRMRRRWDHYTTSHLTEQMNMNFLFFKAYLNINQRLSHALNKFFDPC